MVSRRLQIAWIIAGVIVLGIPGAAFAANSCPWMNEATASALLGGEATGSYSPSASNHPAECTFTEKSAEATRLLTITVEIAQGDPHARFIDSQSSCGSNRAPMKAIGNEAVMCAVKEGSEGQRTYVIGRVRDQVFRIVIATARGDDRVLTRDALRIRINTAAEQVSGNLF